jgi:magnesium-transporting ATPase (P-type)
VGRISPEGKVLIVQALREEGRYVAMVGDGVNDVPALKSSRLAIAPAKDELPLDPVGDLVGRLSGLYRDWDEAVAELAEQQAVRGCQLAGESGLRAPSTRRRVLCS